jgi:hypothetical protein
MNTGRLLLAAALICGTPAPASAVEGSTAAGPIGGTDVRSAILPPPGLYGGVLFLAAEAYDFVDATGHTIPALSEAHLQRHRTGPFLLYVPDIQVLGGSIDVAGIVPNGLECGRLFATLPRHCMMGVGDPYVEVSWSRAFGTLRPSQYPGTYPILEGLAVALGFGTVVPIGTYTAFQANVQGLAIGNNIWDFAPWTAVTYTTRPIIADGTEVSAKFYWNNYLTNPATHYSTGTLLNLDFAVTEHFGRFQLGGAGFYAVQVADDRLFGIPIPPDGRRGEVLELGGVVAYDMPEYGASAKVKVLATAITANTVKSYGVVFGFIKKFW